MTNLNFLFLIVASLTFVNLKCQSLDKIKIRLNAVKNDLESFQKITLVLDSAINEDAHLYDTTYYYTNANDELVYIKRKTTGHYFHITGDVISITEILFMNNYAVFYHEWGYKFKDADWDRKPNIDETKILVSESSREYYKEDGSALISYKTNEYLDGEYGNRYALIESMPREEKLERRWLDRCDICLKKYFLVSYFSYLKKNEK